MINLKISLILLLIYIKMANGNMPSKLFNSFDQTSDDVHGTKVTQQIENMFRDHSYELSIRPRNSGLPIRVGVALIIESITDISEKNMDLTFTLCMHEKWSDPRLKFNSEIEESIVLPSRLIKNLWVPDLFIVGSKNSFVHRTTIENVVLRLFSDGNIFYSVKLTTTVACQMTLYNFPLDMEKCSLRFQSLGHNSDEITLEWLIGDHMDDIFMDPKLVKNMPKFRLVHHTFHAFNVSTDISWYPGTKSQLKVSFELKRYLLSVFFQSYFPAMIMVALAGLGMWIDPKSVPARIALGVTSVLTISTIITGLKSSLPKVSYLTAMDIYLWVCFLFVFSTVLEFCVLNFLMTNADRKKNLTSIGCSTNEMTTINQLQCEAEKNLKLQSRGFQHHKVSDDGAIIFRSSLWSTETERLTNNGSPFGRDYPRNKNLAINRSRKRKSIFPFKRCWPKNAEALDVGFRVVYFFSFLMFNGIYWGYYILTTHHETTDSD